MRPWTITVNTRQMRTSDGRVYLFASRLAAEESARMCYTPVLQRNGAIRVVRYRNSGGARGFTVIPRGDAMQTMRQQINSDCLPPPPLPRPQFLECKLCSWAYPCRGYQEMRTAFRRLDNHLARRHEGE